MKLPRPAPKWLPEAPRPWTAWNPWKNKSVVSSGSDIDFPEASDSDGGNIDFPELASSGDDSNIDFPEAADPDNGNIDFPELRFGCVPDVPDHRDHDLETHLRAHYESLHPTHPQRQSLQPLFENSITVAKPVRLQDDKRFFRLASDQGALNSCSAHAACGLMEYMLRKAGVPPVELSRMFLYWQARALDRHRGNVGASIRSAMRVLHKWGVPPDEFWPDLPGLLDARPSRSARNAARDFRVDGYYRLDGPDSSGSATLRQIKKVLAAGFPVVIGTTIFDTIRHIDNQFVIPFPDRQNVQILGSHALLVLGFQNWPSKMRRPEASRRRVEKRATRKEPEGSEDGYLIVRNSWGTKFADYGFSYLDYRYVLEQLVVDCWTISGISPVMLSNR